MAEFEHKEELVTGFYDRGILGFKNSELPLSSGRKSPVYYNQRIISSFKNGLEVNGHEISVERQKRVCLLAVRALSKCVERIKLSHDHLHGIPQASTVIGGYVAQLRGESYIWQRVGEVKKYGILTNFEGDFNEDDAVVIIDDVITDGASKIKALSGLRIENLIPIGIVAMMDREEGGAANLAKIGTEFIPFIGLSEAVAILRDEGRIGNQEIDWLNSYHEGLRTQGINTTFNGSL